jgi:hypothetical protein
MEVSGTVRNIYIYIYMSLGVKGLTNCAALTVWYLMWVVVADTPSVSCTDPTLLLSSSSKSACLYLVI